MASESTGSATTADDTDSDADPTHASGGVSASSGTTVAGPGETTDAGSTTEAPSSSTDEPPDQPDGVLPDWTLSLDGFDGHALEVLDDGRIAVGGHKDDVAMIHIVDPAGALLPDHGIDPMLWGLRIRV